jgi:hypothetical protein
LRVATTEADAVALLSEKHGGYLTGKIQSCSFLQAAWA